MELSSVRLVSNYAVAMAFGHSVR